MIKLNSKKILILFSLVVLFLSAILISRLFFINEFKLGDNCIITPLENKVDFEGGMKPGIVGEVKNYEGSNNLSGNENKQLPPVIFGTSGTITDVKSDRVIVNGNGDSFSDKKPRELSIFFSEDTIVIMAGDQKIKYQGAGGLQNLKAGNRISIEGAENIRGKIEFIAGIINVLQQ